MLTEARIAKAAEALEVLKHELLRLLEDPEVRAALLGAVEAARAPEARENRRLFI